MIAEKTKRHLKMARTLSVGENIPQRKCRCSRVHEANMDNKQNAILQLKCDYKNAIFRLLPLAVYPLACLGLSAIRISEDRVEKRLQLVEESTEFIPRHSKNLQRRKLRKS